MWRPKISSNFLEFAYLKSWTWRKTSEQNQVWFDKANWFWMQTWQVFCVAWLLSRRNAVNQTDPFRNQCVCKLFFKWNKCQTSNKNWTLFMHKLKTNHVWQNTAWGRALDGGWSVWVWKSFNISARKEHAWLSLSVVSNEIYLPPLLPLHIFAICPPFAIYPSSGFFVFVLRYNIKSLDS